MTGGWAFNARSPVQWFRPKYPELDFRALAAERRASLAPADRDWLKDRLVPMSMADRHERDGARVASHCGAAGRGARHFDGTRAWAMEQRPRHLEPEPEGPSANEEGSASRPRAVAACRLA